MGRVGRSGRRLSTNPESKTFFTAALSTEFTNLRRHSPLWLEGGEGGEQRAVTRAPGRTCTVQRRERPSRVDAPSRAPSSTRATQPAAVTISRPMTLCPTGSAVVRPSSYFKSARSSAGPRSNVSS